MKVFFLTIFSFLTLIQTTFSQDLEGYFKKYYEEGNIFRLQEAVDLGIDPNTTIIEKQPIVDYVVDSSNDEDKIIEVLGILFKSGLVLDNAITYQKIVQNKTKNVIDYLLAKNIKINTVSVDNQNAFSTKYLNYLIEKGFEIDDSIIPRRKFEIKKARFISNLKLGNKDSVTLALSTFMSVLEMTHVELFYAIKTKDTKFIEKIYKKASKDVLNTTYSLPWNKTVYGEQPKNFSNTHYPLTWAMGTNDLDVVKYLIYEGALPLENGNSKSEPEIQKYVNEAYKFNWHNDLNAGYFEALIKVEETPDFSSYTVKKNTLLKEIINKNFVNRVKRSFGIFSNYDEDFFIELKFLKKDTEIEAIFVKTNETNDSKNLKKYLLKDKNKRFFEKLFKELKYTEINYTFAYPEKVE